MSSQLGFDQCRTKRARTDVESPMLGPMSSRAGSNRCQVSQVRIDVESPGPGLKSSRLGPDSVVKIVSYIVKIAILQSFKQKVRWIGGWIGFSSDRSDPTIHGPSRSMTRAQKKP